MSADDADNALVELLDRLKSLGYRFIPTTPATHGRLVARPAKATAEDVRDIFGWSLPFARPVLPSALFEPLRRAGMVGQQGSLLTSRVRVASISDRLFLHSAYPTQARDSVFLGPDSYRFARFLDYELQTGPPVRRLVDIGAGAGVGGLIAAAHMPEARIVLTDINPRALRFARVNARHQGVEVETLETSGLDGVEGPIELAIANPPFIMDPANRTYRDGGGLHGAALSLEWALAAAEKLSPGGRLLLYSGSAIVAGADALQGALRARLPELGCTLEYQELDPDIFGEQLDEPGYEEVERIAAVGAVVLRATA